MNVRIDILFLIVVPFYIVAIHSAVRLIEA